MSNNLFKDSRKVLVFSPSKTLIAIMRSVRSTAKLINGNPQSISFAATGKIISSNGLYYRPMNENVEITTEDVGTLNLIDYDVLCGETRKYYKTRNMSRRNKNVEDKEENP